MEKVMQTKTGIGGNCEGATLATLLGLDINDIPDFWEGCDKSKPTCTIEGAKYQANLDRFLASKGFKAISLGFLEPSEDSESWVRDISMGAGIKHLVNGISPRGYMHSVIYENGQLWHDPHPEGGGVKPCQITFLHPIFDYEVA